MAKALIAVDLQEEYFGKDRNQEQFGDAIDTIYPQDVEKCEKDLKSRGVIYR